MLDALSMATLARRQPRSARAGESRVVRRNGCDWAQRGEAVRGGRTWEDGPKGSGCEGCTVWGSGPLADVHQSGTTLGETAFWREQLLVRRQD